VDEASELLNLRAIEVSANSALGDHADGPAADRVRERARRLLDEVRARNGSETVRREIEAVEVRLLGASNERSGTASQIEDRHGAG
jgi:hypothetical protein